MLNPLKFEQCSPSPPGAIEIVASGHFNAADVAPALDRMGALLEEMPKLDILADVRG